MDAGLIGAGSIGAGSIGAGLLGRLFMSGRCIRRGPVVVDGLCAEARHGFQTGAAGVGGQQQNPARPDQAGLGERLRVWLLAAVVEREDLAVSSGSPRCRLAMSHKVSWCRPCGGWTRYRTCGRTPIWWPGAAGAATPPDVSTACA